MALITDIQTLEPGAQVVLFEIDGSEFDADTLRFHGHAIAHEPGELLAAGDDVAHLPARSIWWQGLEYKAWPVQIDGIGANSNGRATRPTFSAGNVDGRVTALCLAFEDLLKFKLTVRQTLGQYLDPRNFVAGNPLADPTQEALEIWFLDQKTQEDDEQVQWQLSSPGEIDSHGLPGRQMTAYCHWAMTNGYRGPNCGYTGSRLFDDEDRPVDDPAKDRCKGGLSSCSLRFGEAAELPHGGFPAVSLIARN